MPGKSFCQAGTRCLYAATRQSRQICVSHPPCPVSRDPVISILLHQDGDPRLGNLPQASAAGPRLCKLLSFGPCEAFSCSGEYRVAQKAARCCSVTFPTLCPRDRDTDLHVFDQGQDFHPYVLFWTCEEEKNLP